MPCTGVGTEPAATSEVDDGGAGSGSRDDAGQLGFERWFIPFAPGDAVPPYACS